MAQNTYSYHLKNGKTLDLEGAEPPSDDEVEAIAKENGVELLPNDTPMPAPKTEVPKTEAPKVNIEPPPSRAEQMYRSVFEAPEFITKPAKEASDYITTPSDEDESYLGGVKARAKGFLGGALEGASHLLSPANAILSMIPGGSTLSKIAGGALGGAQALHGAHEISEGNTWQGVGDIGMGALGALVPHMVEPKVNIPSPINETPRGPVLPADVDNQAAILEAINRPPVNIDRPQGPWEGNLDLTTKPVGLSGDKLFDLAREKQNMGRDLPPELDKPSGPINDTTDDIKKVVDTYGLDPEEVNNLLGKTPELANENVAPQVEKPTAEYIGMQPTGVGDETTPLFNIKGGPKDRSTVTLDTLKELGITPPEISSKTERVFRGGPLEGKTGKSFFTTSKDEAHGYASLAERPEDRLLHEGDLPVGKYAAGDTTTGGNIPESWAEIQRVVPNEELDTAFTNRAEPVVVPEQTGKANKSIGTKAAYENTVEKAIKRSQERMDAKSKGFKGVVPDESVVDGGDTIPPPPNEPPTNGGEPPQEDPIKKVQNYTEAAKLVSEPEKKSLWRIVRDAQRDILTSFDLSAPGRQGKGLITHPEYWKSLDDMVAAWGSKRATEAIDAAIINHPSGYFKPTVDPTGKVGPSFAEQVGLKLGENELFNSGLQDQLPKQIKGLADPIERSGRAYRIYQKKLKSDVFAKFMDQAKSEGRDLTKNIPVAKKIAESINVSTGRGSFGRLEAPIVNPETGKMESSMAMKVLNEAFFSPHFQKSRLDMYTRIFNPKTYAQSDPIVRKEAWRSLLGVMGSAFLVQELARNIGASISNDPKSSDFRKIKIGNNRIDNMAGLQQYGTNTARFLLGKSTSSSGKVTDLTAGKYGQQNREDVLLNFVSNKLAPIPSLLVAWMRGKEFDGMPFEIKRAIAMRVTPIVMQDLYELYKSDPSQFPEGFMRENPWITKGAMGLMPIMGEGLQTYGR